MKKKITKNFFDRFFIIPPLILLRKFEKCENFFFEFSSYFLNIFVLKSDVKNTISIFLFFFFEKNFQKFLWLIFHDLTLDTLKKTHKWNKRMLQCGSRTNTPISQQPSPLPISRSAGFPCSNASSSRPDTLWCSSCPDANSASCAETDKGDKRSDNREHSWILW